MSLPYGITKAGIVSTLRFVALLAVIGYGTYVVKAIYDDHVAKQKAFIAETVLRVAAEAKVVQLEQVNVRLESRQREQERELAAARAAMLQIGREFSEIKRTQGALLNHVAGISKDLQTKPEAEVQKSANDFMIEFNKGWEAIYP